jgi:hypothetical protein
MHVFPLAWGRTPVITNAATRTTACSELHTESSSARAWPGPVRGEWERERYYDAGVQTQIDPPAMVAIFIQLSQPASWGHQTVTYFTSVCTGSWKCQRPLPPTVYLPFDLGGATRESTPPCQQSEMKLNKLRQHNPNVPRFTVFARQSSSQNSPGDRLQQAKVAAGSGILRSKRSRHLQAFMTGSNVAAATTKARRRIVGVAEVRVRVPVPVRGCRMCGGAKSR